MKDTNFKYEIQKHFITFSENATETKEFNLIKYNDKAPLYDLRKWGKNANGTKTMYKGITLKAEELKQLKQILNNMEI